MSRPPRCPTVVPVEQTLTAAGVPARTWLPSRTDALLAAAFVVLTLAEAALSRPSEGPALHVLLACPAMAALAWRRRFPIAVALTVMAGNTVINPDAQFSTLLAMVLASFTVGSETDPPRSYVGAAAIFVPFVTAMALHGLVPSDLGAAIVFVLGPWGVGTGVRSRATHAEAAVRRADRLERERESATAAAAAEERTRIARELHDIVSHSISVVTIQTQAVRRRLGPDHAREAEDLATVEATAREALAEMRRLFGVLRAEGESASLAPQPGLAELERLAAQAGAGDLDVRLRVEGEPHDLPPGVDLAAYRIVQEGLTNALRHSGGTRVEVVVGYLPRRLDITVEDDGRGLPPAADRHVGGHGLVGIRERVAVYGGRLELGASALGGVRLHVTLPVGDGG